MGINVGDKELGRGDKPGVYLFLGSDVAERSKAVRRLEERLVEPEFAEWCILHLDGGDATGAEVLEAVSTPPFIGKVRVVVVRSAQDLEEDDALVPYVESPADFSVLVLVADAIDKRRKLFQAIKRHGTIAEFQSPASQRLPRVIAQMAEERNVRLEPGAVDVLIERAGDDMSRIRSEVEKLTVYAGDGGRVTREEADLIVARGVPTLGQYAIFDFVDAVAEGKGGAALIRLDELLRSGEPPLLVLVMIARQFRLLLAAIGWQGESPKALAKALGLRSDFPAKKAFGQSRRWTRETVSAALEACAECDAAMKRGVDGRRALESLTVALVRGAAENPKKRAAQSLRS